MTHRCNVCKRTNNPRLALNPEDVFMGRYLPDDRESGEICEECQEIITDTLSDFEEYDDDQLDLFDEDGEEQGDIRW